MIVIGECIHIVSKQVKTAIENKDKRFIQELALRQAEKGANYLDLNIGPQRRGGPEVMTWMVDTVQEVTDTSLSLDTTNREAMEAGLARCKVRPLVNSTDATPERLAAMMPLAAKYNANIIALTLAGSGLPSSADARVQLALEAIVPAALENGVNMADIFLDPLVLTINGNQDQVQPTIEAMRFFKLMSDPPPLTTCGLSNISSGAPPHLRPLLHRVFLPMMLGAGLDSAICDPLDDELMAVRRILETRDASTAKGRLYLSIYDSYAAGQTADISSVDTSDPELRDIVKTIEVLENKWIYAHSYLQT